MTLLDTVILVLSFLLGMVIGAWMGRSSDAEERLDRHLEQLDEFERKINE